MKVSRVIMQRSEPIKAYYIATLLKNERKNVIRVLPLLIFDTLTPPPFRKKTKPLHLTFLPAPIDPV